MNDLKQAILSSPVVQRIHELENYIDSNIKLNEAIVHLKEIQKQMVHAKEFHQTNQYAQLKKEYDEAYQEILDFPFVEEYIELLEETNEMFMDITNLIESKINEKIRNW
ncbi:YlbF family regulator [bacterium]|nr:YlbF family regulator [bacterium]